jgi:transcription elongation factor GreA
MVSTSTIALTVDGMQRLQDELETNRQRHSSLAEALAAAPDDTGGVLADLTLTHRRIAEIEAVLARATTLDPAEREPGVVGVGSTVTVRWDEDGEETYTIVEPAEVDPGAGRISYESPVGQALVERRAGERVAVETLAGPAWLEVVAVA